METERADQEAFRAAVAADKKKGVSHKSPYTLGFVGQVKVLTKRTFRLKLQDRFQLLTSYGLAWVCILLYARNLKLAYFSSLKILAIVIGAAFYNLPLTSAGAFTRGSVIFVGSYSTPSIDCHSSNSLIRSQRCL